MIQSNINHLRRLLAWMECEYCLNPASQKGLLNGLNCAVGNGLASQEKADAILADASRKSMQCPVYIRQAVRALQKMIAKHERGQGIVEAITEGEEI